MVDAISLRREWAGVGVSMRTIQELAMARSGPDAMNRSTSLERTFNCTFGRTAGVHYALHGDGRYAKSFDRPQTARDLTLARLLYVDLLARHEICARSRRRIHDGQ
jgi:hypothetical protein